MMPALPIRSFLIKFARPPLKISPYRSITLQISRKFRHSALAPARSGVKPASHLVSLILWRFMILLIDNYDSFTHNLAHLIGGLGEEVEVVRNDALTAQDALASKASAIVISPGPGAPSEAGVCVDLVKGASTMPIFGVCLGMQAIVQAFGGTIRRAEKLMHGKTCGITHEGGGLFKNLPSPFTATRYHSLVADQACMPSALAVAAFADDDREVMAVAHKSLPIAGVQFHPESIATEHGADLLANFLHWAKQ